MCIYQRREIPFACYYVCVKPTVATAAICCQSIACLTGAYETARVVGAYLRAPSIASGTLVQIYGHRIRAYSCTTFGEQHESKSLHPKRST